MKACRMQKQIYWCFIIKVIHFYHLLSSNFRRKCSWYTSKSALAHLFLHLFPLLWILNHIWEFTNELFTASKMLTRRGSDECFAQPTLDACQSSVAHTAVLTVQILVPMLFQVWIRAHQKKPHVSMETGLPKCSELPRCHVVIKVWYD